ncbi:sulfatase family protein [Lignipirellula cremea]|uniref:Arylsulfatase n=1 Tax=Lignipirellula cremea TaxID=2528010 RepID=A0A518E1B5_9BACT|nr:sulfatase [Lignipirellula cremea]QDU97861.1 Arylsulfatase [Lignipirellula cremea]
MPNPSQTCLHFCHRLLAAALLLAAWPGLTGSSRAAESADTNSARPNIVWIFVEDMNGWYGCYGDDTVPTPHLDRLAARGMRFDRAYMPAGVCSACRSAIALGAMQTSLGVHNHRSSRGRTPGEVIHLPEGVKTVYEQLRDQGYYVISSQGKNDFNFEFELDDLYDDLLSAKMGYGGPDWRKRKKDQPFFAQIQLLGGKNSGRFQGAPSKASKSKDAGPFTDVSQVEIAPYYPDIAVIRNEYAHHYDTIRQTDDEVGRIMQGLKEDGLLENTVVFFWTDHGMRLYRHKQWVYDGSVRVPLIIAGPGIQAGSVREDLVSGIDITAATLALAGAPAPAWSEGQDLLAKDFHRDYVISARDRCDFTIDKVRAVTTPRYRYLRNFLTDRPFMQPQYRDGRPELEIPRQLAKEGKLTPAQAAVWSPVRVPEEFYDLENDPHEIHNLADNPAHRKELQRHRDILAQWIKETGDQGQQPESIASLEGVLKQWKDRCTNPEYDKVRAAVGK